MSEPSFARFMNEEKQRIRERCTQIDEMFEALEHEKKALIKISDGLDSMAALYEETGQSLDAAQSVGLKHSDPFSSYRGDDSFRVSELAGNIRAIGRT